MLLPARFIGGSPYGDVRFAASDARLGTGGTTIADTATTSVTLPKPACTECQLLSLRLDALVAAISAAGTVLAQVFKRDNSGTPANRTLTGTKSLEADVIDTTDKSYAFAITSTSIQNLTFQSTDTARIDVVTTSSVGTQPTVTVTALWAIIKP